MTLFALGLSQARAVDVVDVVSKSRHFDTLTAAVKAAGLVDTLKSEGPFTVFAPTDEAFRMLPKGTLENLLKPENKEMLKQILTYHVVPGRVTSCEVKSGEVSTANGRHLRLTKRWGRVYAGMSRVIHPDIHVDNGITLHSIKRTNSTSSRHVLKRTCMIPRASHQMGGCGMQCTRLRHFLVCMHMWDAPVPVLMPVPH